MTTSPFNAASVESDLRRELADRIERGELELPLLSHAATRIATLCLEGDADPRALAELLNRDPALAGHVLRVANSSAYAPVEPIVSLQQAVSRLGSSTLGQIAFAVAVGSRIFQVAGQEGWVREMWRHAALTAGWAREISRLRRRNGEASFLCGLLHDVGMPVLLQAATDLLARAGASVTRQELESVLLELHGRAGARLAEAWKMPACAREAMLRHHSCAGELEHADEVRTTGLADALADWTADHPGESVAEGLERLRSLPLLEPLGIYDDELEGLLGRRERVCDFAGALQ